MNAQWRRWAAPIGVACLVWGAALGGKLVWEAQAPLDFISTHAANQPDRVVVPELTMAAAQRAPFGPAEQARARLLVLAMDNDDAAQRALLAASSGARAFGRPELEAAAVPTLQKAVNVADDTFPAPHPLARLLAALLGLAWPGAALLWMSRAYDADGAPRPAWWRWAALTTVCFLTWCVALSLA